MGSGSGPVGPGHGRARARSRSVLAAVGLVLFLLIVAPAAAQDERTPPTARFSLSPDKSDPGQEVTASALPASRAHTPCTPLADFAWDWDGDGRFEENGSLGSGAFASRRTFGENGVYPVTLRVTDACGQTATSTLNLTVGAPVQGWRWDIVLDHSAEFLRAGWLVVWVSLVAIVLGLPLGVLVGLARLTRVAPVRWIANAYVEFLRGTPLLVQIFIVWLALPAIHPALLFSPLTAGIIALVVNTSAYQGEIVRAGIQAIPTGQTEAALALGFTRAQALRHVVLPQALRLVIPPLTNEYVILVKDTSLLSTIGVVELMLQARILGNRYYSIAEPLLAVAVMYFVLTYTLSLVSQRVERKLAIPGLGISGAAH
ncbi:MAG TPA: ABC transporter permease subunit [Candidatus Thermoplasmatota archaeon]|nr:ABC transporter permease subunit [Candidatus Thermoplasmatota archaeon]